MIATDDKIDAEAERLLRSLMNVECDNATLDEIEHAFKFNDAVLRHLTVKMTEAVTAPSPMMKEEKSRSLTQIPDEVVMIEVPAV